MQTTFDPVTGAASLVQFQRAQGQALLAGASLREGLLSSLLSAELLAATAGVVPFVDLGGGQKGVVTLGAARERIDQADPAVKTIYLAAHGAARQAQAHARPSAKSVSLRLDTGPGEIGFLPVVAIVVIGVAAIVAGAWFAKETAQQIVQTMGEDLRASYAADAASKIAMAQLAAGQQVDPEVYRMLGVVARTEAKAPSIAPLAIAGGAAVLVGGAVYAWSRHPWKEIVGL